MKIPVRKIYTMFINYFGGIFWFIFISVKSSHFNRPLNICQLFYFTKAQIVFFIHIPHFFFYSLLLKFFTVYFMCFNWCRYTRKFTKIRTKQHTKCFYVLNYNNNFTFISKKKKQHTKNWIKFFSISLLVFILPNHQTAATLSCCLQLSEYFKKIFVPNNRQNI